MLNTGRTGGLRFGAASVALIAAISLTAGPLAAQDAASDVAMSDDRPAESTLELTGSIGLLLPMSVLGTQGDTLQADLSTKPAFSAELDLWFAGGFGLGLAAGFTSPELSISTADAETGRPDVADLGTVDYLHAEAVLLWRPELRGSAAVVLPYFGAGAGVRRLTFDTGSGFEDATDVTIVLNAGAHVPVSDRLHLRLDVRDLVSSFDGGPFGDSNVQHDVFASVGVGIGL